MSYTEFSNQPEYSGHFWNAMRGRNEHYDKLHGGYDNYTSTYNLPDASNNKLEALIKAESVFRNIATVFKAYRSSYRIFAKDCENLAEFIPDGGQIPIYDGINDFTINTVDSHKLAAFVKLDEDYVQMQHLELRTILPKDLQSILQMQRIRHLSVVPVWMNLQAFSMMEMELRSVRLHPLLHMMM